MREIISGDQATVWLRQGALPEAGDEYVAAGYAVCYVGLWMARPHLMTNAGEARL